jgi:mono/diheme cytochrome c family protein
MHSKSLATLAAAAAILIGHSACAAPISAASPASIARGKRIAEDSCASCHAIGTLGESPNAGSPPFKTLTEVFPIESLDETFVEGISSHHPGMPIFAAPTDQLQDLLNYLKTIQLMKVPVDH